MASKTPFFSRKNFGKMGTAAGEAISHGAGKTWGGFKTLMLGGVVAAAATGLLAASATNRDEKRFDPDTAPLKPLPPMLTPDDLMQQAAMGSMSGPADGRGEFEFRNRVLAGRGQAPELAASQPRMSAIAPESVTDLGGVKPLGV